MENYVVNAYSTKNAIGIVSIKDSEIDFGITADNPALKNPAELFLASLSACILKNVERFSELLNFEYTKASIILEANRKEKPPSIDSITYKLYLSSEDPKLNLNLLQKNIEKFGTIYNTIAGSCSISGTITITR